MARIDKGFDAVHIADIAQGEYVIAFPALDGRDGGPGAGGDDELVVMVDKRLAREKVFDFHGLLIGADGKHLVLRKDIHVILALEKRRGPGRELLDALHFAAQVIGHAAPGIGNKAVFFVDNDLRVLGVSPGLCRGGRSCGHRADNDDTHMLSLLLTRSRSFFPCPA
jgi:hypothetical protein